MEMQLVSFHGIARFLVTLEALSRAGNCLTLEQYTEQTTACIGVPLRKDQLQDIYSTSEVVATFHTVSQGVGKDTV